MSMFTQSCQQTAVCQTDIDRHWLVAMSFSILQPRVSHELLGNFGGENLCSRTGKQDISHMRTFGLQS